MHLNISVILEHFRVVEKNLFKVIYFLELPLMGHEEMKNCLKNNCLGSIRIRFRDQVIVENHCYVQPLYKFVKLTGNRNAKVKDLGREKDLQNRSENQNPQG